MAGEVGFLARWSKRKRAAPEAPSALVAAEPLLATADASEVKLNLPEVGEPEFDLASLPTLDELTGTSDMSAFLQKGVPQALQNAALRKAWVLDPFIKDHIGPVECGWDFNDPMSMTGFGPLDANVDASAMLKQIMGEPKPDEPPEEIVSDARGLGKRDVDERDSSEALPGPHPAGEGDTAGVDSPVQEYSGSTRPENGDVAVNSFPKLHVATHNDRADKIEENPLVLRKKRHGGAVPG